MSNRKEEVSGQPDKNLAAETRPVPSQAEGDRETIDEDLAQQKDTTSKDRKQTQAGSGSR